MIQVGENPEILLLFLLLSFYFFFEQVESDFLERISIQLSAKLKVESKLRRQFAVTLFARQKVEGGSRTLSFAATGQRATVTLQPPYLINFVSKTINIHLFHNWVRLFGKDVLEIPELKSNLIIGNLFILLKFNI